MSARIMRLREALRWQRACLADEIHRTWRRWWYGKPGRHGTWQDYDTTQIRAIEADLAGRPWPADLALEPAPALSSLSPAPGPELFHHDWTAEAELRLNSPHCFAPDADYWAYAWAAFNEYEYFGDTQRWPDEAKANELRAVCGLGPRGARLELSWVA